MYRFYSSPEQEVRVSVVGEFKNGILGLAVARCSKKDSFIRKKGRAIAEGRLNKGKLYKAIFMEECDSPTFVEEAKKCVSEVIASKVVYI